MNTYRITLEAQKRGECIQEIITELERQNSVSRKMIEDEEQAINGRLKAIGALTEYAGAVKADGMR